MMELRRLAKYLECYEECFAQILAQKVNSDMLSEQKHLEKTLAKTIARNATLTDLLAKIYEDNISGKLSDEMFMECLKKNGFVDAAQTKNLAPADKVLYALRDVTGTVDSIPLIASSIMSKKLASGADGIVLDVKCGSGAFMTDFESAKCLANAMIDIAHLAGKKCTAVISDMNQPLGYSVGNLLEVREAIHFLSGKTQNSRLYKLVVELCSQMFKLSDEYTDLSD